MNWNDEQIVVKIDTDRTGYENSGIFLMFDKLSQRFGISSFGHCSCNGSWDTANTNPADWEGDMDELITICRNKEDVGMKGRPKSEADYDYARWKYFYELVLQWLESGMGEKLNEYCPS